MNYIEFEIGGKTRGFKLGLGFLGELLRHYNTDMVGLGHLMVNNPFSVTPAILYYSHKQDCLRSGKPVDFTLYNVDDWVEELPETVQNENIEKVMLLLMDSIKKHLPKLDGEGSKKKNRLG